MTTCKDGHVMATGKPDELIKDLMASAAAFVESGMEWPAIMSACAAGVEIALDDAYAKMEGNNG